MTPRSTAPFQRNCTPTQSTLPVSWRHRESGWPLYSGQVGQLQWHMFACSLPEETNLRQRWLRAVRRDVTAHIKDAAIARVIVRCWTHTRTTDEWRQRRRTKSSAGARPRCDEEVEPGGSTTRSPAHTTPAVPTRATMKAMLSERRGRQRRSRSEISTTLTGTTLIVRSGQRWRPRGCSTLRVRW